MAKETLTRRELFELVWGEPMNKLTPRFGMSDVGLKKLCRRHDIPTPGLGHWAKLRAGKKVRRPRLKGDGEVVVGVGPTPAKTHRTPADSDAVVRQKAYEAEHAIEVKEVSRLSSPAARIAKELRASGGDSRSGFMAVKVTPGARRRALLLVDAFVRAARQRDFEIEAGSSDRHGVVGRDVLRVHGEGFQLQLRERHKQVEHVATRQELRDAERYSWKQPLPFELVATGELTLEIEGYDRKARRKRWRDTATQRLEDVLGQVFVELVRLAETRGAERREAEEREARRKAEWQAQIAEETRRRQLEEDLARWVKAEQIRGYVAAVLERAGDAAGELAAWASWATGYAEALDPRQAAPRDPTD